MQEHIKQGVSPDFQGNYIQVIVQEVNSQLIDKEYVYELSVDKLELVVEIVEYLEHKNKVV